MKTKIAPKSRRVPELAKQVVQDIITNDIKFLKKADEIYKTSSAEAPIESFTKLPLAEKDKLGALVNHGLGVFECSSGEVWRVIKTAEGEFLERDDELTAEALMLQELLDKES